MKESSIWKKHSSLPLNQRKSTKITTVNSEEYPVTNCVSTVYDAYGHVLLLTENTSKPSMKSVLATMRSYIKSGSHLIHNGERTHSVLIEKLDLAHEVCGAVFLNKIPHKENPLDPLTKNILLPYAL